MEFLHHITAPRTNTNALAGTGRRVGFTWQLSFCGKTRHYLAADNGNASISSAPHRITAAVSSVNNALASGAVVSVTTTTPPAMRGREQSPTYSFHKPTSTYGVCEPQG